MNMSRSDPTLAPAISHHGGPGDEPVVDHAHPAVPSPVGQAALERAAAFFRAAGDTERLRLLALLGDGERCVSELAASTAAGMSTVSQRLRVLRTEGLVTRRREGKHLHYRLADRHVADLIDSAIGHTRDEPKEDPR
jgi:ArsR family transcriptional regulator, lead/cadmium/zinc/bismuth-responsive transcriptional repressor